MTLARRVLLAVAAPFILAALLATAWLFLPGIHRCMSIYCGSNFDSGGANVFGRELFTPEQSIVMALGVWAAAAVLARGVFSARWRWTPVGFGVFALASVIALALPSLETGPPPSVPCSTPGLHGPGDGHGPVVGRCVTGAPPVDTRLMDRGLVFTSGLLALGVAVASDRRRRLQSGSSSSVSSSG